MVPVHRFRACPPLEGSTFRVKDKEGIEDLKASLKRLIFPSNFANMHPKCSPGTRIEL
jgi:hypothetical protein